MVAAAGFAQTNQSSAADGGAWLAAHRDTALEALMPLATDRSCVIYRGYNSGQPAVAERYVSLCGEPGSLQALLIASQGGSIQQQLLALHAVTPDVALDDVIGRVRILRTSLSPADCPAWKGRLDRLPKLEVVLREPRDTSSAGEIHQFAVRADGAEITLQTQQDSHPWVRWGLDAVAALAECAGPASR